MKITDKELDSIRELSQEFGMTDTQIAQMIGCSRATINRARNKHDIPIRNVKNKMDKSYICNECGNEILIKRSEQKRFICGDCMDKLKNIID